MKIFNVKLIFDGKFLHKMEFGDFGECDKEPASGSATKVIKRDALVAWPVDPKFTGKSLIAELLELPVTDYFFNNL
jgi:hypothetical protein